MKYSFILICFIFVSCSDSIPRRPVNKKTIQKREISVAINKAINKKEMSLIKEYVRRDSLNTYTFSPFGFAYAKLSSSGIESKITPVKSDEVRFLREVLFLNNQLIYAQEEKMGAIEKSHMIRGLHEGLKLMHEGDEFKFIFTSFVAHGFLGDQNKIKANTPLVMNIKLLNINKH